MTEKQPGILEKTFEPTMFASRWLLAPVYAGLVLAVTFFIETAHVFTHLFEADCKEATHTHFTEVASHDLHTG